MSCTYQNNQTSGGLVGTGVPLDTSLTQQVVRREMIKNARNCPGGYRVASQNGSAPRQEQVEEVARGIREIESVIGDLSSVFARVDLTVIHTGGEAAQEHEFTGRYNPEAQTITAGMKRLFVEATYPSLACDVGRFIDCEAGKRLGVGRRVFNKTGTQCYETTSLAEHENYYNEANRTLLDEARQRMVGQTSIYHRNNRTPRDDLHFLSHSANSDRDVMGRLTEQYIAEKLKASGQRKPLVAVNEYYAGTIGYWDPEDWSVLEPMVKHAVNHRLNILHADEAKLRSLQQEPRTERPWPRYIAGLGERNAATIRSGYGKEVKELTLVEHESGRWTVYHEWFDEQDELAANRVAPRGLDRDSAELHAIRLLLHAWAEEQAATA